MKPADKVLTYQQARELRFFTKNCTGLRQEFYKLMEGMEAFKRRLDRLDKTCDTIEEFFKDKCHYCGQPHEGIYRLSEWWCKKCLNIYGGNGTHTGVEAIIDEMAGVAMCPHCHMIGETHAEGLCPGIAERTT